MNDSSRSRLVLGPRAQLDDARGLGREIRGFVALTRGRLCCNSWMSIVYRRRGLKHSQDQLVWVHNTASEVDTPNNRKYTARFDEVTCRACPELAVLRDITWKQKVRENIGVTPAKLRLPFSTQLRPPTKAETNPRLGSSTSSWIAAEMQPLYILLVLSNDALLPKLPYPGIIETEMSLQDLVRVLT